MFAHEVHRERQVDCLMKSDKIQASSDELEAAMNFVDSR